MCKVPVGLQGGQRGDANRRKKGKVHRLTTHYAEEAKPSHLKDLCRRTEEADELLSDYLALYHFIHDREVEHLLSKLNRAEHLHI